ncbi:MAG: aminopeptidase P family protein [Xanthomonadaceae bacterium]|nr:aminopeptidase P family protein [Xanthomonadaceae bacterium]
MIKAKVPSYFKTRRNDLMAKNKGGVFVLPGNHHVFRNPDVEYPFRQESNAYYLTGYDEAESWIVITPSKFVMFVREKNAEREMWEGQRYGIDGAKSVFGADEAYPVSELKNKLPELLKSSDTVFYRTGMNSNNDSVVLEAMEKVRISLGRSGKSLQNIEDPGRFIGEMRIFKTAEEVELLKKACSISAHAQKAAMSFAKPGLNERDVAAYVDYELLRNGCERVGYGSIIAGGKNATCLHYRENNEPLKDGDLLLIDAAGEYDYYTSDITRTFPIGREFTKPQAKLYDALLKVQKETIAIIKPGIAYKSIHEFSVNALTDAFLSLGLLKGSKKEIVEKLEFKRFFPHGTSHLLGMDVHDVGLYMINGESRKLEAGMVFTIEPGIYIQPGDDTAPSEYKNLGMRIEDDILVTKTGYENLTQEAPKEREEIESLKK